MSFVRMMDARCHDCENVMEIFTAAAIGMDTQVDVCPKCGKHAALYQVLPCAPSVRTPMNSASYLDGHREDSLGHQQRVLREQTKAARMKQIGAHDVAAEHRREARDMADGAKLTDSIKI